MEAQFAVEDLLVSLMEKKNELLRKLYKEYKSRIEAFLLEEQEFASKPLSVYLEEVQRRKDLILQKEKEKEELLRLQKEKQKEKEELLRKQKEKEDALRLQKEKEKEKEKEELLRKQKEKEKKPGKKKGGPAQRNSKRRKSMVVYIDDMSFCFGKEELEQISGPQKEVDPQVKNVLTQMNELFKKLNKS